MTEALLYYVYLLTNWNNRVLYVGVTNHLERRLYEHKHQLADGFTKNTMWTSWFISDSSTDVKAAIEREKQIKGWTREKKNRLVESMNPEWKDLSLSLGI